MHGLEGRLARLGDEVGALAAAQPFRTGWCLVDLRSGAPATARADDRFPAASTRKVAVLVAALAASARHEVDLRSPVTIDERHRDEVRGGLLQHLTPGLTLTFADALTLMIVVSDNLCTAHVIDRIGLDAVNATCARAGMTATAHRHALAPPPGTEGGDGDDGNVTTPADQVRLLVALHEGAWSGRRAAQLGLTPELCAWALRVLSNQMSRDTIPARLPPEATVAHKPGATAGVVADVGIVSCGEERRFALAVLCDGVPERGPDGRTGRAVAADHVACIARASWDALVVP